MTGLSYFFRASLNLLLGFIVGACIGWLIFSISSLSGKQFFLFGGGLIGLVISALFFAYSRRVQSLSLSEVTISLPEFAEIKFAVDSKYRRVAWALFIETLTRVSTQPLDSDAGSLREALNSLYKLFADTRNMLKDLHPPKATSKVTVEVFAVRMLNQEIRPFLSKWHVRLQRYENSQPALSELGWEHRESCRQELELLRHRLITYTRAFGELAGLENTEQFFQIQPSGRRGYE